MKKKILLMFLSLLANSILSAQYKKKDSYLGVNIGTNGLGIQYGYTLNPRINLRISSVDYTQNMIKGSSFYVQFSNIQTEDISLDIINSMGSNVFHKENLINQRSPQRININNLTTGVYFVKIYANKKVYVQRVFITNN